MAEIRHTFQGGKMNKDLDERIVPQGEYRDALNIEVRTSSDSDIGAIQNLYGNKGRFSTRGDIDPTTNWMGRTSYHVGSISNEKTNKAYFFVASPPHSEETTASGFTWDMVKGTKLYKDMIVEYNQATRSVLPVFIDVKRIETRVDSFQTVVDNNSTTNGSATVPYYYITIGSTDQNLTQNIRAGMSFQIYNGTSYVLSTYKPNNMGGLNGMPEETIKIVKVEHLQNNATRIYFDRYIVGVFSPLYHCVIKANPVLDFSLQDDPPVDEEIPKNYITGINIIDDLLFWTDNRTEPKKINIARSKAGCSSDDGLFNKHTKLMISDPDSSNNSLISLDSVDVGTDGGVKPDHVTMIRRAPRTSPKIEMSQYSDGKGAPATGDLLSYDAESMPGLTEAMFVVNFKPNEELYQPGDEIKIGTSSVPLPLFDIGDRIEIYQENGDKQIVAIVADINYTEEGVMNRYKVLIDVISNDIEATDLVWKVRLYEIKKDPYFELKFGRFSFRYKYQDGEYSSFAPWSELAFIPDKFDYVPKKGFNLGMVNNVRQLKITDFIVDDALRPDDVTEVDILYKDTVSPNVYIVKTISRSKHHEWDDESNNQLLNGVNPTSSYKGVFEIKSEMIHRTLESSQILRAWDNVPRKALAQEVTGNRVVYGNYLQNYDIDSPVFVKQWYESIEHGSMLRSTWFKKYQAKPGTSKSTEEELEQTDFYPFKSLKSIRKYRIGVVFGDKYGRETPVIGLGGMGEISDPLVPAPIYPDSVTVPKEKCASINKLKAQLEWTTSSPEPWMEYFKFYVKETTNEYYNLVQDRWYDAEDGNLWLSFQSSDRNKVDENTYLILKNEHGNETPVLDKAKYKILAIKNEAPDFIKTTDKIIGCIPMETNTNLTDSMIVNFDDTLYDANFDNIEFKGIGWGRLRAIEGGTLKYSNWVKIARMNDTNHTVTLVDPLGDSANFTDSFGLSSFQEIDEMEFEIKDAVVENRPEFDGKFFIKVYKDATLSTKIMSITEDGLKYNTNYQLKFKYVQNNPTNTASASNAQYQGDYSGESNPTAGTPSSVNWYNSFWGTQNVVGCDNYPGNALSGADAGHMGECFVKDDVRRFWEWYAGGSGTYPISHINTPFIDEARGSGGNGDANALGQGEQGSPNPENWHPGLHNDAEGGPAAGMNAIQWATMGKDGFNDQNNLDFYNRMTEAGSIFRFSGDPTGTIYQISGHRPGWNRWNYHIHQNTVCKECDEASSPASWCYRTLMKTYFHIKGDPMKGMDVNIWDPRSSLRHDGTNHSMIEFVEAFFDRSEAVNITDGNAIWETEPKDDVGMDLYYEATDAIPIQLKNETIKSFIPLGCDVRVTRDGVNVDMTGFGRVQVCSAIRDVIMIGIQGICKPEQDLGLLVGDVLEFIHPNGTITQSSIIAHWQFYDNITDTENYFPANNYSGEDNQFETGFYRLDHEVFKEPVGLSWFNCYAFGNGLESDRIRDDFNAPTIDNGCKVSTTLDTFGEERRGSGMIWSGIYNSTSGVNNLNEFNMAQPITKDLNPSYGSLQALKTRDTNVVAFCEDKVFQILANKDALYNADGSSNVTASNAVLGDAKAFKGDYGISTNPESLAVDYIRMYFTDKQRNKVIRLSQDGLTPISDAGMSSWFRDNLEPTRWLVGSFDEIKGEYNLTLNHKQNTYRDTTVSFSEKTKGWTSFKSFIPQTGLSINDEYLTGKIKYDSSDTDYINNKIIWSHHNEDLSTDGSLDIEANNFYGEHYNSTVDVLFNQSPEVIKSFLSMNYEGTQAKVDGWDNKNLTDANGNEISINNPNYQDLTSDTKAGWHVSSFKTNLQEASIPEFIEREGKWFEYIKGDATSLSNLDTKEFSVQGIGVIDIASVPIINVFKLTITENG